MLQRITFFYAYSTICNISFFTSISAKRKPLNAVSWNFLGQRGEQLSHSPTHSRSHSLTHSHATLFHHKGQNTTHLLEFKQLADSHTQIPIAMSSPIGQSTTHFIDFDFLKTWFSRQRRERDGEKEGARARERVFQRKSPQDRGPSRKCTAEREP